MLPLTHRSTRSPQIVQIARCSVALTLVAMLACAQSTSLAPQLGNAVRSPTAPASTQAASSTSASASIAESPPIAMYPSKTAAAAGFCTKDEFDAASDELTEIERAVSDLPNDASSATALTTRIEQLLASRCYLGGQLTRELDLDALKAAKARAVRVWWEEGGQWFLRDALQNATAVYFAPTVRPLLAAELLPKQDPLRMILCPNASSECDPVAAGAVLEVEREEQRVALLAGNGRPPPPTGDYSSIQQECARASHKLPRATRFEEYVGCVQERVAEGPRLPIARYRSPKGWLVLRGRRGHYDYCNELRAYDLESGTAYIAGRCAGRALHSGTGVVAAPSTYGGSALSVLVGVVSPDALRRLAFALALGERVETQTKAYARFEIPVDVAWPRRDDAMRSKFSMGGMWGHSAQSEIRFDLVAPGALPISGQFLWPDSSTIGEQAIDNLIVSTEITFVEGCPKATLPAGLFVEGKVGAVSRHTAPSDAARKAPDELEDAILQLRRTKLCGK
jgi:hypothetical protein